MRVISGVAGAALAAVCMSEGIALEKVEEVAPPPKPDDDVAKGKRMTVNDAMERTGTSSPKAALDRLKELNPNYRYLPHTGAKQKAKAERARIKALKKSVGL